MKKRIMQLIIITCLLSMVVVGCSNNEGNDGQEDSIKDMMDLSGMGESGASSEDMSSKEVDQIIDKLVKVTAEKFGVTEEAYLASVKENGKTAKEEFQVAADVMGISLKEYYEYEKIAVANMSEEAKENNKSMADALSQIGDLDLDNADEAAAAATDFLNGMTGGGDRVVEGDISELCRFKVDKVTLEEEDKTFNTYELTYETKADFDEVFNYFKALLEGTPGSMIVHIPGIEGGTLMGTINDSFVTVIIDNEDGDDVIEVMLGSY